MLLPTLHIIAVLAAACAHRAEGVAGFPCPEACGTTQASRRVGGAARGRDARAGCRGSSSPLPKEFSHKHFHGLCAVSDTYRFIYIHVPKAASSFNRRVAKLYGASDFQDCTRLTSKRQAYFKFTFVRDPVDRLLSAFSTLASSSRRAGAEGLRARSGVKFMALPTSRAKVWQKFQSFLDHTLGNEGWDEHTRPQRDFVATPSGQPIALDFIGSTRDLRGGWEYLRRELGLAPLPDHATVGLFSNREEGAARGKLEKELEGRRREEWGAARRRICESYAEDYRCFDLCPNGDV